MKQSKSLRWNKHIFDKDKIDRIKEIVLSEIKPSEEDIILVKRIAEDVKERILKKAKEFNLDVSVLLVGSAARNTWILNGKRRDIDLFILFPTTVDEEFLEEAGINLIEQAMAGWNLEERYAEHPYVRASINKEINGEKMRFDIDLVPCFDVPDPSNIISAVDRTPHHNKYVMERIKGKEGEVILLKKFLEILGIYGSDNKTKGFSGYLCELLILRYGSFEDLLLNTAYWRPPVYIDIEGIGCYDKRDPFVFIDPVDPKRNVAAALSYNNLCIFIDASRSFLEDPSESYFRKKNVNEKTYDELKNLFIKRDTYILAIYLHLPDIAEDIIYPQLERSRDGIKRGLEDNAFKILNSYIYYIRTESMILFEFEVWKLPKIMKHIGPKVFDKSSADRFKEINKDYKIFIKDCRYVVEKERKFSSPEDFLKKNILKCALGKDIRYIIENNGYNLLIIDEILSNKDVRQFLSEIYYIE